jgi:hypothetical protein
MTKENKERAWDEPYTVKGASLATRPPCQSGTVGYRVSAAEMKQHEIPKRPGDSTVKRHYIEVRIDYDCEIRVMSISLGLARALASVLESVVGDRVPF